MLSSSRRAASVRSPIVRLGIAIKSFRFPIAIEIADGESSWIRATV